MAGFKQQSLVKPFVQRLWVGSPSEQPLDQEQSGNVLADGYQDAE